MLFKLWASILITLFGISVIAAFLNRKKDHRPLPPGPPRKPLVGNLGDLPRPNDQEWQYWLKHKDLYGPISSLTVMGKNLIILNNAQLAVELLEKRSVIHSSRPQQNFTDMSGWNNVLGALRNPDHTRQTRKHLYQEIGSNKSVSRFNEIQTAEVSRFLLRVLEEPDKLQQHIRKLGHRITEFLQYKIEAGAIVLKIGYGYTIEPHKRDPLVDLADKAMEDFSFALLPATWAVDFIPICALSLTKILNLSQI
ncbi:hypothetical protein N7462_009333 [Penicillium macrosclerotiorum]|uniref:uncharacterized protein n=1 Tax=Penicillium macrosclerotiorum TaxID=303699 RepID=UPI002548865A|nr:uncharacterized protein N7462_009333 [Penicillium macrosclerotiorum]KAJ5673894.1 hypothetical protein N7462_009333 [Penicillium macrosclerotiorum]